MAKMIVYQGGTFRRPKSALSFTFAPSPVIQTWPQDVVDYAVGKGLAEEVKPHQRGKATARKGNS